MRKTFMPFLLVSLVLPTAQISLASEILVVDADQLASYWVIKDRGGSSGFPAIARRTGQEGCARLGFVIEADGTTSTHRVFSVYPMDDLAAYAVDMVQQWQYEPVPGFEPIEPVYTEMTLTFHQGGTKPSEKAQQKLRAECEQNE